MGIDIKTLLDLGGVSGVFAVFAVIVMRLVVKSHREDIRVLMTFLREERIQRDKIMNKAELALKELGEKIDRLGGSKNV